MSVVLTGVERDLGAVWRCVACTWWTLSQELITSARILEVLVWPSVPVGFMQEHCEADAISILVVHLPCCTQGIIFQLLHMLSSEAAMAVFLICNPSLVTITSNLWFISSASLRKLCLSYCNNPVGRPIAPARHASCPIVWGRLCACSFPGRCPMR